MNRLSKKCSLMKAIRELHSDAYELIVCIVVLSIFLTFNFCIVKYLLEDNLLACIGLSPIFTAVEIAVLSFLLFIINSIVVFISEVKALKRCIRIPLSDAEVNTLGIFSLEDYFSFIDECISYKGGKVLLPKSLLDKLLLFVNTKYGSDWVWIFKDSDDFANALKPDKGYCVFEEDKDEDSDLRIIRTLREEN